MIKCFINIPDWSFLAWEIILSFGITTAENAPVRVHLHVQIVNLKVDNYIRMTKLTWLLQVSTQG